MHAAVILGLNRAQRDTVGIAFARRPAVILPGIARLRKSKDSYLHTVDLQSVEVLFKLVVTIGLGDLSHREFPRSIGAEDAIPLLMIAGDAQSIFSIAVPWFEVVVTDRP